MALVCCRTALANAKTTARPAGRASIFFEGREKAASASSELANNFPANADLEATTRHGAGEWFKPGVAVKSRERRLFPVFSIIRGLGAAARLG
jgi:hypothetical protein